MEHVAAVDLVLFAACITTLFVWKRHPLVEEGCDTIMLVKSKFKSIELSRVTFFEIMTLDCWANVRASRPRCAAVGRRWAYFSANLVTVVIVGRNVSVQNKMEITEAVQREKIDRTSRTVLVRAALLALNDDLDVMACPTFLESLEDEELESALDCLEWTQ